jgi:diguanylate cyclase
VESASLFRIEPTLGPLEQDYRRHYLATDASQAVFILVATVGAFLIANLVDLAVSGLTPESVRRLWVFAVAGVISGAIVTVIRRATSPATLDLLVFAWSVGAALLVIYYRISQAPVVSEVTIAVLALGCYTLVPNRLLFRVIPAFIMTATDAGLVAQANPAGPSSWAVLLAYGFIHLVGIWSSSTLHNLRRRQFEALVGEQAAVSEMQRLVHTDSLTGLLSRRHFMELADQELDRFRRYQARFTTLIVDLDHFKPINDRFGHGAGDEVLRRFAELLRRQSRRNDLVGRLGGEEFCLVLPETVLVAGQEVAERIVTECRRLEIPVDGRRLSVTVSVGVTEVDPDDADFSNVLRRADTALYSAKEQGRNRVETLPRYRASSY